MQGVHATPLLPLKLNNYNAAQDASVAQCVRRNARARSAHAGTQGSAHCHATLTRRYDQQNMHHPTLLSIISQTNFTASTWFINLQVVWWQLKGSSMSISSPLPFPHFFSPINCTTPTLSNTQALCWRMQYTRQLQAPHTRSIFSLINLVLPFVTA